jgi:hypothetical protein
MQLVFDARQEATARKITGVKAKANKPVLDRRCICIFPFGVVLAFEAGFGFD